MKKLISVASLTGLLTLSKMIAGFIIGKFVAIYVGPYGIAMIGQLQNLITIVNGLVNSPVGSGIVRYTAQNVDKCRDASANWWRASVAWTFTFCLIFIITALFYSDNISKILFNNEKYGGVILIYALLLPFTAIGTMLSSILNGYQHYKKYILIGIVSVAITTALMILLIVCYNITGAMLALTLQTSFLGIITLILCRNEPWYKLNLFYGSIKKIYLLDISKYIIMAVSSALFFPISLMLVRKLLIANVGWDDAGQWQAVWKISETYLAVITLSLSTYFLPKLSSLKKREDILPEVLNTLKIVVPLSIFLASAIYFCREIIVTILFTKEFTLAERLIPYQLIGDCIKVIAWVFAFPMLALGKTKWYIICELIAAFSFSILSHILLYKYGIEGITLAYIITYLIYLIFILFNYRHILS